MAVKVYSFKKDGNKFCSYHTQVKEMRCKDGSDKILIDEKLMEMIEKLFSALKCSKYIIQSGYRTPEHSVKVGGSKNDQHTKGKAVDVRFYGADGKVISSKEVSCIAQDLGFKGIANVKKSYDEIHLDSRTSGTWYGNEIFGNKSVTKNFYDYYNIDRNTLRKKYGLPVTEVIYYAKYSGKNNSIVDALKALKITSSFSFRLKIAKANCVKLYIGTAAQNRKLLDLLKKGKLIKP